MSFKPISKPMWLFLLAVIVFSLWLWFSEVDATIYWWCMNNLTGVWQHIFSLLSTAGQGATQLYISWGIALILALIGHWSLRLWFADIVLLPLAAFHFIGQMFFGRHWADHHTNRFSRALHAGWNHLMTKPRQVRVWVVAVPIFLIVGLSAYPLKVLFGRPRPKMLAGHDMYAPEMFAWTAKLQAYPSGHTITTFALLACLLPIYPRFKLPLFIIASIIALGRVGVGSHWLGDVLAGMVFGYALAHILLVRWQRNILKDVYK